MMFNSLTVNAAKGSQVAAGKGRLNFREAPESKSVWRKCHETANIARSRIRIVVSVQTYVVNTLTSAPQASSEVLSRIWY